jgi:glycosyltransferase involved in cell wall biosynthesis
MLVALTTHPIQYQVPIWKLLAARGRIPFQVWFMSRHGLDLRYDPGFKTTVAWDIDLLDSYEHCFIDTLEFASQGSFSSLTLTPGFRARLRVAGAKALWLQGWQVAAYVQAVYVARWSGLPVWLRGETNVQSAKQQQENRLKAFVRRNLLHNVDQFLTVGSRNREFYLAQGIDPARLFSAPYCVDNSRFANAAENLRSARRALRSSWGIDEDAFVILFVGKFQKKKRPADVIQAAKVLISRRPELKVHTLWVGAGELGTSLRNESRVVFDAEYNSLSSSVHAGAPQASFLGFLNQTEIAKAYVAADCLILPSDAAETWGLVVNEAMACGLPCIVSEACGCADDLVKPLFTDLCYPVGNIDAMERALELVKDRPPKRDDLQRHVANYDCLRTVKTVEELYLSTETCKASS